MANRRRPRGRVLAALVVSHWVFDWVTHDPDLPLWPGGPTTGLGLWRSVPGTVAVESLLFVIGVGLYLSATRSKDRIGVVALWAFLGLIVLLYAISIVGPRLRSAPSSPGVAHGHGIPDCAPDSLVDR